MTRLRRTETKWAKSFPTIVASPLAVYTCTYERGQISCKKRFSRQCDLRRHQKNHTRPSKCKQCNKGFPSPKDLERHDNSVHNNTVKYFCPHEWCRDSIKPTLDNWSLWGFRRKDHWQKHMKSEHQASREIIKGLQEKGIPVAMLKEGKLVAVLHEDSQTVTYDLPAAASEVAVGQEVELAETELYEEPGDELELSEWDRWQPVRSQASSDIGSNLYFS